MLSVKDVPKAIGIGLASFIISGSFIDVNSFPSAPVPAVFAEFRAAQKRTYFRFTPKLTAGMNFYKGDLKKAIDKEDWPTVKTLFEEFVYKVNKDDLGSNQMDTPINQQFYRPMTVLAGSFAERAASPKQRALTEIEADFEKAMVGLEGCTKDMKGEGFFAATTKMPTGAARVKQAKQSWEAGKLAINNYIDTFNDGLMLELNKLDKI